MRRNDQWSELVTCSLQNGQDRQGAFRLLWEGGGINLARNNHKMVHRGYQGVKLMKPYESTVKKDWEEPAEFSAIKGL